jgi:plastocyanin
LSSHLSLRRLCAISLALTGLALGACGGSDDNSSSGSGSSSGSSTSGSSSSGGSSGGGGAKVALAATESGGLGFDKKTASAKAGNVTLTMDNPSADKLPHAIAVEGQGLDKDGKTVQPGGKSTVTANLKPGKYTFYCPVDGHRQAGMEGTLTVK